MKKLLILLLALSFAPMALAGSVQDMHKAVIARQTVVSGGYTATFVSHSVGSATGTTEVVVTAPSGISDGDLLVAFTSSEAPSQTITPPSGFTVIDEPSNTLHDAASYYKIASSESGNYTWTFGTSTSGLVVHMVCVTKDGGTWVTPTTSGYHNAGTSGSDSTTGESTGDVTTQDGSVLVCGFSQDGSISIDTPPTGMTGSAFETPWLTSIGTMRGACAYQEYATGATVSKTLVWASAYPNIASAVVCYAE